jgi:ABC-type sulfate/molybdate transport systems ATPase subunit
MGSRGRPGGCLVVPGGANRATRFPFQLSRGQQRLCALARALAVEPALVYIDDLYRGASEETWEHFIAAMRWARSTYGTAFVTVLAVADETPEGIDRLVPVKKVMS